MAEALEKLRAALGQTDIYLLDQFLRGNVPACARILDAGCGRGRNLRFLASAGFEVFGNDQDEGAIHSTRAALESSGQATDDSHFRCDPLEALTFEDDSFDFIICNAVLHFARDHRHFMAMAHEMRRVLAPGGLCFCRLASNIGIESLLSAAAPEATMPGWHRLPDGSDRYLVDVQTLLAATRELDAELIDPIKTVNVQNLRCMSNWVWRALT